MNSNSTPRTLTICIPTYKRPETVVLAIDSIAAQIEADEVSEIVEIYVTNDCSPDATSSVLEQYRDKPYITIVHREQNLGMSRNLKHTLLEASGRSDYQLLVTDDDTLQEGGLRSLLTTLEYLNEEPDCSIIWTPRYSYTENGDLECVVCDTFSQDSFVAPSTSAAGRYMRNGFILSGLMFRGKDIDFEVWEQQIENAFFPMIVMGELLLRKRAYFWKYNLIHHTVLNKCHWEAWGDSDAEIELRLFVDLINSFAAMYHLLEKRKERAVFLLSSLGGVFWAASNLLRNHQFGSLRGEQIQTLLGSEGGSFSRIFSPYSFLAKVAVTKEFLVACIKAPLLSVLSFFERGRATGRSYAEKAASEYRAVSNMKFIRTWIKVAGDE